MRPPLELWLCRPSPAPDLVPLTRTIRRLPAARHHTPLEVALVDYSAEMAAYMTSPVPDEDAPLTPQEEALVDGQTAWMEGLTGRYETRP